VWIDFNQNGTFESNERVYSRSATNANSVSGSFTIPTNALNGLTRMRVSMKYNGIPTACETFSYGEVEDYTVVIGTGTNNTYGMENDELASRRFNIYPNPVKDILNVETVGVIYSLKVYDLSGKQVLSSNSSDLKINVSTLE